MKSISLVIFGLCLLAVVSGCSHSNSLGGGSKTDLEFAKAAFTALANGDAAADDALDWENFSGLGMNVGAQYNAMPSETAKAGFRQGFISSFSKSYQATGARAESLTNWRIQSQDATQTIVAADTPKGVVFLMTVTKRNGQQKLAGLQTSSR